MLGYRTTAFVCACLIAATAACERGAKSPAPAPAPERADARVRELADAYLEGFFQRNPDQVTLFGVPGRHHDALPDNALRRAPGLAGQGGRLARAGEADRSGHHRGSALTRDLRHRPRGARIVDWRPRVPLRAVDGQPVRERLAGAGRLHRDDSAGRDRRGAEGGARALEPAAEVRRHRDRQPARRAEGRLLRAEGQRPHRHRSDGHADRDADRRLAVRLAVGARQDARVHEAVRPAGARADRAGVQAVSRFPRRRNTCRRRARRSASRRTRTAPPATTRPSGFTARCRCRRARCTPPACARSSTSTRR